MKSGNLTVSDARLKNALKGFNQLTTSTTTEKQIKEATENVKLRTGVVNKYYMDLNKVEVTLNQNGGTVLCRVLRLLCNEFVTKYTPEGDYGWDEKLTAGYITPRSPIPCVVLPTMDSEKTTDYFLIGFYNNSDVPETVPAPPTGNIKISYISAVDEYLVQFGKNGFNVISNHLNQYEGVNSDYNKPIDDLATKETLTKDYYTKEEVDKLIEDLKEELSPDTDTEEETV